MKYKTLLHPLLVAFLVVFTWNTFPLITHAGDGDIIISEVMYNAILEDSVNHSGEWVEIYNQGSSEVNLTGWSIKDNDQPRVITSEMCPNNSCVIPAGECWLIASTADLLQQEFDGYTNPPNQQVDSSRTIFLGTAIGNRLANSQDYVLLSNADGDGIRCVSWSSSGDTLCPTDYVNGGGGADTDLYQAKNGQSIALMQGQWDYHASNGSPYDCSHVSTGGTTAIELSALEAHSEGFYPLSLAGICLISAIAAIIGHRRP